MIDVGLNGFGKVGMYLCYLASKSSDINLVINDVKSRREAVDAYNSLDIGLAFDNGSIRIGDREFIYIQSDRGKSVSKIPWSNLDWIIEAAFVASGDELKLHKENAEFVVITGTPKEGDLSDIFTYNEGVSYKFDPSCHKIISFGNDRAQIVGPLLSILEKRCGVANAHIASIREPYGADSLNRVDSLGQINRFMPQFEGYVSECLIFDKNYNNTTTYNNVTMVFTYLKRGNENEVIQEACERYPGVFSTDDADKAIIKSITKRWADDMMGFEIGYHPYRTYTKLLYDLVVHTSEV